MMNKHFLFICLVTFCLTKVQASNSPGLWNNYQMATHQSKANAFQLFRYPSQLSQIEQWELGMYSSRRFNLKELQLFALAFSFPTKSGNFAIGGNYFGHPAYNEKQVSLGYGRKLSPLFSIGLEIKSMFLHVDQSSTKPIITFGLSSSYQVSPTVAIHTRIFNPLRLRFFKHPDDILDSHIGLAIQWDTSQDLAAFIELQKGLQSPFIPMMGISYRIKDLISLAGMIQYFPFQSYFQLRIHLKQFTLGISNQYHPVLGHSPSASIFLTQRNK